MLDIKKIDWKYKSLATLFIVLIYVRLWWLATSIFALSLIVFLFDKLLKKITQTKFISTLKLLKFALYSTIIFIIFRSFIAEVFYIPSMSMENTLYEKDVILVNKLTYGPLFTKDSYHFLKNTINKNTNKKTMRLAGLSHVKQGDILVSKDLEKNSFLVKRCVGLPGDIFEISNGKIYTNDHLYKDTKGIKELYSFQIKNKEAFQIKIDSLKITINKVQSNRFSAVLSVQNIEDLKNDISFLHKELGFTRVAKRLFPKLMRKSLIYGFSLDNYGPILIPKKGTIIKLDDYNFMVYCHILKKYEGVKLKKNEKGIFLNGKLSSSYTFKHNYYFLMGDNRKKSNDSRFWGFIPEDRIIGKVSCILFSYKHNKFQWDRLFKSV